MSIRKGHHMLRVIAISFIFLSVSVLGHAHSARADETPNKDYGTQIAPYVIDEYSRIGSKVKVTFESPLSENASATLKCTGASTKGGWEVTNVTGLCWHEFTIAECNDTECTQTLVPENPVGPADVLFYPSHRCSTPDPDKNFCVHNYAGAQGISGDTGDDMFKLDKGGGAFFEYGHLGETDPYRVTWIERTGGVTGRSLMVPSGPPSEMTRTDDDGNTITVPPYGDYKRFIDNSPGFVTTQKGCFPVSIGLCVNEPPTDDDTLKENGTCGVANGQSYVSQIGIAAGDFCASGELDDSTLSATSDEITWKCAGLPPINGGTTSGTCRATVISDDALCGLAHTDIFASRAELEDGQLCSAGTLRSGSLVSTDDGWDWDCNPPGPGGIIASCTAFKDSSNCESFFDNDNVVFVQDLSGSFGDDIVPTRNALLSLFNSPSMSDWRIGLTAYQDIGDSPYGGYKKITNFLHNGSQKATILNTVNGYAASGGGDYPESQIKASHEAAQDFLPQAPAGEKFTIVLITDATSHQHVPFSTLADDIRDNDLKFIVLATSGAMSHYQGLISSEGIESYSTVMPISSSSTDLAAALLSGLVEVHCE